MLMFTVAATVFVIFAMIFVAYKRHRLSAVKTINVRGLMALAVIFAAVVTMMQDVYDSQGTDLPEGVGMDLIIEPVNYFDSCNDEAKGCPTSANGLNHLS